MTWLERLREAVRESGMKQYIIALDAGISPECLSRILTSPHASPRFDTVVRITHALGHSVAWLLNEPGHPFSAGEVQQLRKAAAIISSALDESPKETISDDGGGVSSSN